MQRFVSEPVMLIFIFCILFMLAFMYRIIRTAKVQLIHKIYFALSLLEILWMICLIVLRYVSPDNTDLLHALDSLIYLGVTGIPVMSMYIAIAFTGGGEKFPRKALLLLVIPLITNVIVWTDPLHHLFYKVFSFDGNEVVPGPWMYISGVYSYLCAAVSAVLFIAFAVKTGSRLAMRQSVMFTLGSMTPVVVSFLTTFKLIPSSIVSTPLSNVATIVFHGFAIYSLHLLDIQPVATRRILDWISDGYLVLSEKGLVISYNAAFRNVFGKRFGVEENRTLEEGLLSGDVENKNGIYNLLTSVDSSRTTLSTITYEQALLIENHKYYYMIDVSPLLVEHKLSGFVVMFKDVTQVKESMQRLQDSQSRMLEQERLAFLGQMVGGLAHNLKTPIMSISGSMSATENLIMECRASLGDNTVTEDDWLEIFSEMEGWIRKVREGCSYMSDIITAVKGQATNASTSEDTEFTIGELLKRVTLLMRHELQAAGCQLVSETTLWQEITLHGDINNLIQVLNNLLSNAIYAQKDMGGGVVVLGLDRTETDLRIYVKDTGAGVPPRVRERLFKEMTTSKGAAGTGLGLFISNAVVRGKFGGEMWYEPNLGGGSIFGFTIPLENVSIREDAGRTPMGGEEAVNNAKE